MTKSLVVDPAAVRAPGQVVIPPIPVNAYQADWATELDRYGAAGLTSMLHDMIVVREFESMLNSIKTTGAWQGIEYNHKGPAHLSMGQEAAVVGQAAELAPEDFVFGSHRSHGEILAKSFSAARQLPEAEVARIMGGFLDGDTLRYAERVGYDSPADLAANFILFGTLAEIFARRAGFNRGMGGSMHAFFPPFGSMPNNAIVGGSAPIAVGAALFKRVNRQPGIVVCNIGDGSAACGPVWEALSFATMDQFLTLWRPEDGGRPPILFNFFNNFYGMGGQTDGETMGYDVLARIGAGVNPEAMHAERVDGWNPLAVADAVRRQKAVLTAGEGPALLDVITYRYAGHSPSDAMSYRTREEVDGWRAIDSIDTFATLLVKHKVLAKSAVEDLRAGIVDRLARVLELAASQDLPRVDATDIEQRMYSNGHVEALADVTPELSQPLADNPRVQAIAKKSRTALDAAGQPVPKARLFQFRDGLFEALAHRFSVDPTLAAWGEENRDWGGAFAVYRGLTELLPYRRLFNAPIAEAAIVGAGVGYAMAGGRAVVELMYCDFLGRAGDEVFNQASKWQAMSAGLLKLPLVIRVSVGNKYGAQHSQDWSSLCAHIPGLKVYFPATPTDAKGMLNRALAGTDPVVFLESQLLYDVGEQFEPGGVPEGYYETPEGQPAVRRQGQDVTIATYGATLYRALAAAETLAADYGVAAEVIDLRYLAPLDYGPLVESVQKTGRLLLSSDAVERGSFLQTVAATVQSLAFGYLDAPVTIVGSRNHITPAPELEDVFFPQPEWLIDAIHTRLLPLPGHVPTHNFTPGELQRRARAAV
ncbi:MAG: dehydrogenase [Propionibacteriaceae bacterium]|jgi:2-oxoisovalerate dehydrogenase E1 component|nr:dehydrogenase [Propionibacteriaceae bacterium]